MSRRTERLSHQMRDEIGNLLLRETRDPRLSAMISVTRVIVSPDLRHAKIMVSAIGDKSQRDEIMEGFNSASSFFRKELAKRMSLRHMPELYFVADDSIEHGSNVLELIQKIEGS